MRRIALFAGVICARRHRRGGIDCAGVPGDDLPAERLAPEGIDDRAGRDVLVGSRANGAVYQGACVTGEGDMRSFRPGDESPSVSTTTAGACSLPAGEPGTPSCTTPRPVPRSKATTSPAADEHVRQRRNRHAYGRLVHGVEKRGPLQVPLGAGRHTGGYLRNRAAHLARLGHAARQLQRHRRHPDGKTLIIVQSDLGKLFTVDPKTGVADEIELTGRRNVLQR